MLENARISAWQFAVLVTLFTIGSSILVVPASLSAFAYQDAWIAALIGVGTSLLLVWLYCAVGNISPGKSLIEINEKLLGKWAGKTVSFLLILSLFFAGAASALYYVGFFLTTHVMPQTPVHALNILFVAVIVMGTRLGIETLARSAEILFPFFAVLFGVMFFSTVPQIHLDYLQPVLEKGAKPIATAVISYLSFAILPDIILLMIFPYVHQDSAARKAFLFGNFIGGLVLTIIVTLSLLVLGPEGTTTHLFPSYALAQKIKIGDFLQRVEVIVAIMWFITFFFRLTIYLYGIALAAAQIFELKHYRPLVLPLGMILVVLSLVIFPNVAYEKNWDTKTWIPYILSVGLFLPLFLLGIAKFRK
ncbi:GerAB/ArcD/ProY family transporter [Brevibacillus massiliensis]|uniref:GerAB/ArcD/ProY family transporter n=1 Tax=Brevibacillus massiliensis TaxID=1118054 RepID=UPI000304CE2F|nr:endospore germination permease [Brevibacillus massiliensis]